MKRLFAALLIFGTSALWADIEPIHFDPPAAPAPAPAPAAQPASPDGGAKTPDAKTPDAKAKKPRKHHAQAHHSKKPAPAKSAN